MYFSRFCINCPSRAATRAISAISENTSDITVNLCHAWPRNFEIWSESSNLHGSFEHLLRDSEFRQERRSFFEDK